MKKLFLLLLLSLGLANVSNAEVKVPEWIEADTMDKICKNVTCAPEVTKRYKNYFRAVPLKGMHKAFAIGTLNGVTTTSVKILGAVGETTVGSKKNNILYSKLGCYTGYKWCEVLFVDNYIHDKALYKLLMRPKTTTTSTPANAKASGSSFMCNTGYPSKESHFCWIVQ